MSDRKAETVRTYDESAEALAEYFQGIGPRTEDIDRAFKLAGNPENARVLEIGCGDGRDAAEIVKRAGWYQGFDISKSMIRLAEQNVPEAEFEVGDAVDYPYPPNLDIVFAFASLLHVTNHEISKILSRVNKSLNVGGVVYISLKYARQYKEEVKSDEHGRRTFYFYNPQLIKDLAGARYDKVFESQETKGGTKWFEIALRKSVS